MKKSILITGFILFAAIIFNSCVNNPAKEKTVNSKDTAIVQYTCPMHPEVISSKHGNCPKCGMTLVEKK